MRSIFVMVLGLASVLSACQSPQADRAQPGSPAWYEQVDARLGVSDGHGHGPDHGSREWCNAVHFRMHGSHAADDVPCDREWIQAVDKALWN